MSVVNAASLSAEDRPIGAFTRADLVVSESVYQGETCWIVKDPLAMKYYRLKAAEYTVFTALRSDRSLCELKTILVSRFPESVVKLESIQKLVVSLHQNGLLKSNAIGQAQPLRKRRRKELQQKSLQLLSSLLSLRFPGVDPEGFLNFLYPKLRWVFSTWFTVIVWLTVCAAGVLVVGNLNEFYAKLPDFQSFFAFDNLVFMGFVLILTKTIHEFGHGLMCKHYGGECHEIGFMLLVMTPAMYCNTSDSWILPNRWHRMAIGAAGMYFEFFLASICTFVWWFTVPGWIHYFALNIVFLSSVSTIVFNANPLLRYDGYYILSDFLEIPNLAQKSKTALTSTLRVGCLGMKPADSRLLPQRNLAAFAVYSVASFAYRWFIMFMIFWFIIEIFEPWGLVSVGYFMIGVSLIGMVGVPLFKLVKYFLYPGRLREVKKAKLSCTLILLAAIVLFFCCYPVSYYVYGHCVLRPLDARTVLVQQPGTLVELSVKPGDRVRKGQVLARLENRDFDLELAEMSGQLAKLNHDLTGFELSRNRYLDSERLITQTKLSISLITEQINLKRLQAAPLSLRSPRDGIVILPPNIPRRSIPLRELRTWAGTPLDQRNIGSFLDRNTPFCLVAEENEFEAVILVDQADVRLLSPGQSAKFAVEQLPEHILNGTTRFVSSDELKLLPRELSQSNGGPIAVKLSQEGTETPILTLFEARATISIDGVGGTPNLSTGFHGDAKILVGKHSLGWMSLRYLRNLVNFR